MILIDTPTDHEGIGLCCHMISTIGGNEGRDELVQFAVSIGLRADWIQNRGTHKEHFDLMRFMIEKAERSGARMVTDKTLIQTMHQKKPYRCECPICRDINTTQV